MRAPADSSGCKGVLKDPLVPNIMSPRIARGLPASIGRSMAAVVRRVGWGSVERCLGYGL